MSAHNIRFYEELMKIIFKLSSNTHLICSSAVFIKTILLCGVPEGPVKFMFQEAY